jgi:hypothetical protein
MLLFLLLLLLLSPVLLPPKTHVLQVSQADLHHAALQAIGGNLQQQQQWGRRQRHI